MSDDTSSTPKKSFRSFAICLAAFLVVAGVIAYANRWRIEAAYLEYRVGQLYAEAEREYDTYSLNERMEVSFFETEAGEKWAEASKQLFDLRYANDHEFRAEVKAENERKEALNSYLREQNAKAEKGRAILQQIAAKFTGEELDELTAGMIIGMKGDDGVVDVSFLEDMLPDVDEARLEGRTAMFVHGVRIAKNTPIHVVKLVHFQQQGPIGVAQVSITTDKGTIRHKFPDQYITRTSVVGGTIEYATMTPELDDSSTRFFNAMMENPIANIEAFGKGGYTTFGQNEKRFRNAQRIQRLFLALKEKPELVPLLKERALDCVEYTKKITEAMEGR